MMRTPWIVQYEGDAARFIVMAEDEKEAVAIWLADRASFGIADLDRSFIEAHRPTLQTPGVFMFDE